MSAWPGRVRRDGVTMAHYEFHGWCLLVLAWVLVPFYARSLVFTMPEFLERRFSVHSRYVLSIVSLIAFIVTKIAVGIFAGGVVFGTLLPEMQITIGGIVVDSFWIGSVLVIVLTGLYTVLGGMRAVAYGDAVQVVILIVGSALLTIYGLIELGGWSELRPIAGSEMFNLWKPLIPVGVEGTWSPVIEYNAAGTLVKQAWYFNTEFPWLGMAICAPVIGLWYWCTDQYIVQRALGAPNEKIARRGSLFAAILKLFPVYLFIIPGLIAFALAKSGKVPGLEVIYDPATGKATEAAQAAFPLLVQHLLPTGLRGIVVAGLLSALMSSLAGVFNASSTLFTVDIYEKTPSEGDRGRTRPDGPDRDRRAGRDRPGMDPCDQGRIGVVHVPAIGAELPGTTDLRGLFLRCVLEAAQCEGLSLGVDHRIRARDLPAAGGHTCDARDEGCLCPRESCCGSCKTSTSSTSAS